ncbi:MAG TPA: MATE family efflux transporter [Bacteroidales bacterium]|nr:MATE family efflux transporter [Bacteroidales bacterium]
MKDLTIGNEGKLIVQFAMPMVYGNIFQQLYNVVDSIIIGHYLGKESLAAVGASFPIIFLLIALMIGFSMGFTIIIAQYFGAKNMVKVKQTIDTSYIIILFASLITTLLGISFSETIFRLTGMPDEVIPDAATYLNIYFAGSIFSYAFNGISAILRGLGDSRTPLIFLIISTISNVFLDLLFIVVFKMGIDGAAYATIISKAGAVVAAIIYINKKFPIMNISFRRYEFVWDIFKTSLRIGLPTGLQQTFVATGLIALYGIVNKFGTVTIAAYGVANRIDTFASMLAMNFASALSAFVGQNIGANKPERVRTGLWTTWLITSGISIIFSIIVIFFGKEMMRIFTPDTAVIEVGNGYLVIVGSFYILFSSLFVVNAVMRGAGDTLIPMFITLISLWLIRVPASYFLAGKIGVTGIWWAIPFGWAIGLILTFIYYFTGRWKTKGVIKHI